MELEITLEDFEIRDLWTNNTKWNLLIEAKEIDDKDKKRKDSFEKNDLQERKMALIIKYVTDSTFKTCPYHLKMDI